MTSITTSSTTRATDRTIRRAGAWCLAGGAIGTAQAAILLAWPGQADSDRFSYPFTSGGFVLAQATFALQHLLLLVGVAALLSVPAVRVSRTRGSP